MLNSKLVKSQALKGLLSVTFLFLALSICSCNQPTGVSSPFDGKAKDLAVKSNMMRVQAAAEAYFKDHTYMYPNEINDEFKSYFAGGDVASKKPGSALTNPFTGQMEWPVIGTITDLKQARSGFAKPLQKGVIEYSPINGGKSYAIRGGGYEDKELTMVNGAAPLVLSRDDFKGGK